MFLSDNARITQEKYWIFANLLNLIHHTHQTFLQMIFIFSRSLQNAQNDKIFSQDHVKTFVKNLLGLKPTEFYLRENQQATW